MSMLSPENLSASRLRAMGPALGPVFHALWSHVVELHGELQEFRKLYGAPESVAVLNDTAGQFFGTVRKVLWEHVLLYVARLTDEPDSGPGRKNLTLRCLPDLIDDPDLKRRVAELLSRAEPKWRPVRALRNKWLAHLDLYVGTNDAVAAALPDMDVQAVESALSSMGDVLSKIEEHHFGPADRRYDPVRPLGDADHLLFWLRRAVKSEAQRRERIMGGRPLPGDFDAIRSWGSPPGGDSR